MRTLAARRWIVRTIVFWIDVQRSLYIGQGGSRSEFTHVFNCGSSTMNTIFNFLACYACYQPCSCRRDLPIIAVQVTTFGPKISTTSPALRALLAQEHLVVVTASSKLLRSVILIWVVLVSVLAADVVLVIHVVGTLLGLGMGTLAVVGIHA